MSEVVNAEQSAAKLIQIPQLNDGEIYVGLIGNAEGKLHHVILLPSDNDDASWQSQMDWAKSIGGDLPNRIEQAMLWANHRDQFKKDLYWSSEVYHRNSGWAWYQLFSLGNQTSSAQDNQFRARAVRRLSIQ